jgi:hypothetical protein
MMPRQRVSRRQLRQGYGFINTCAELDPAVAKLGVALAEADRVGVSPIDTRYAAAFAFHKKQTGWWSADEFVLPSTCRNLVMEANKLLLDLNVAIGAMGGQRTETSHGPEAPVDLQIRETVGELKWVVIGGGVILGLIYLGPLISAVGSIFNARPKGKTT